MPQVQQEIRRLPLKLRMPSSRTRTVVTVGLGQLLAWGSSYYLVAILGPPMAASLGLPNVAVFAMFAGALVVAALLGPYAGHRVDRFGGRRVLLLSNGLFATALLTLAAAQSVPMLTLGWLLLGAAMPFGLYDAAFATLVALFREQARRSIVGVTLIAGFASSVSWPLSAFLEHQYGWRAACAAWALLHLSVGAGLHYFLLDETPPAPHPMPADPAAPTVALPPRPTLILLAAIFAASGFVFAAMAAHLPRVLEAAGCTPAAAVFAASLVGVFQVMGRLAEVGYLGRLHPLVSARVSMALHPLGALLLAVFGAPAAVLFTALHGAGIGLMTIVKGTLPLALFGPAGFGRRAGWLEAPSRVMQAAAPVVFALWLEQFGAGVLWISGGLVAAALLGVLALGSARRSQSPA
jgi:MFS family permease